MKYKELFQFDPITSIVQLTRSSDEVIAKDLVHSFVASKEMEDSFTKIIIPHLQFKAFNDNKALMIIGNYGTGKSHMMGVIAALAEDAKYVQELQSEVIQKKATEIAGKFKVLRLEIGGVATPLEQIILRNELEPFLSSIGIDYKFPASDSISSFKTGLEEMMKVFVVKYPDTGLMIVIDEMLEFLLGKNQTDQIKDLGFLRQVFEFCQYSKFRTVLGMQESIFDNPQFKFVAQYVGKIKERTEMIQIQKSDIRFVVEKRLLKKTSDQKAKIRTYLEQFRPYYSSMSESFENYVTLFPVHPSFLDSFTRMIAIEKREVLKTISNELNEIQDKNISDDTLELITIDKYWPKLNATVNVFEGMKEVRDCYGILKGKLPLIKQESYRCLAQRIVNGLCMQRMEDTDVSRPIGLTAEKLRDTLCLFDKSIAEMGSDELDQDLLTHVETTLKELMKVVNGQFISKNQEDQYYIDICKTVDFDQIIASKIQTLSPDVLDQYYYELLKEMLECSNDSSYRSNSTIWDYELQWLSKKMFRKGWLFFGTPNERPTAVPEKDFYLFFIPLLKPSRYQDGKKVDELILKLVYQDELFLSNLKLYSAAKELAESSGSHQKITYLNKADKSAAILRKWLLEHLFDSFLLSYRGTSKTLKNWLGSASLRNLINLSPNATLNFKDSLNAVSSFCLENEFLEQAPEYPSFSVALSSSNFKASLNETFRHIITRQGTGNLPIAILNGLELVDNAYVTPRNSRYAKWILSKLQEKKAGNILRKDELLSKINDEVYLSHPVFRLEKGFVGLLLVALIASGDIVLTLRGKKYDAANVKDLISEQVEAIADFDSLDRPKDWDPAFLSALVKLFDLPEGNASLIQSGKESVMQDIQEKNEKIIKTLAEEEYRYREGLCFWGEQIPFDCFAISKGSTFFTQLKNNFEKLKIYNSTGKLKNPNISVETLEKMAIDFENKNKLVLFAKELEAISSQKSWFDSAKMNMTDSSDWINDSSQFIAKAKQLVKEFDSSKLAEIKTGFFDLKNKYIIYYSELHSKARLAGQEKVHYNTLLCSEEILTLTKMQNLSILSKTTFVGFQEELLKLKPCSLLTEAELAQTPLCPHCSYNPQYDGEYDAALKLGQIENKLEELLAGWIKIVVDYLEDPINQETIKLMLIDKQRAIRDFIASKELPKPLTDDFVAILNEALSGLVKKEISKDTISKKLLEEGRPITIKELREKFEQFVAELVIGEEPEKIRIILE